MMGELLTLLSPTFQLFDDLRGEVASDPLLIALHDDVRAGSRSDKWKSVDGLIIVGGKVYMPATSPNLQAILEGAHGTGNEGIQKTLLRLCADFHVPSARDLVREFVKGCVTCQHNRMEQLHPAGLLQPLEVPSAVWSDIAMDFIEGLRHVNGKSVILMVVDRFSKYVHFIPLTLILPRRSPMLSSTTSSVSTACCPP